MMGMSSKPSFRGESFTNRDYWQLHHRTHGQTLSLSYESDLHDAVILKHNKGFSKEAPLRKSCFAAGRNAFVEA